ncbi:ParB N-terminal domain-containing protein [Spiroplasma poulsonii]|nr:ParB N-terminal domain-containing protein [Spiroplasma poulsonii]UNF61499.1 ParB N-terminal domain-containing protein [Spiroplasma poulsonii]
MLNASGYYLVAGERRSRAAKLAGLTKIPAIIVDFNDQQMKEV